MSWQRVGSNTFKGPDHTIGLAQSYLESRELPKHPEMIRVQEACGMCKGVPTIAARLGLGLAELAATRVKRRRSRAKQGYKEFDEWHALQPDSRTTKSAVQCGEKCVKK